MDPFEELRRVRVEKMEKLKALGVNPFAYHYPRTHRIQDVVQLQAESEEVSIAGRLISIRRMGGASFAHVQDNSGRIQIYVKKDQIGQEYEVFGLLDLGDIIGVRGKVFRTKTGEITIFVDRLTLLSKSLRPLPIIKEKIQDDEKVVYDQFADIELRYRQRYVDLIVNPDVKQVFIARSRIISAIRKHLEAKGYIEVETPVLQPLYGGAFARPFTTHHHTLDRTLYLRIADELYLKRLVVGGFEGVFEIAKDFRNEGMDRDHNPEFTMLELYVSYEDYHFMMNLVEEMVSTICDEVFGTRKIKQDDLEIDFQPPWKRVSYYDAVREKTGIDFLGMDLPAMKKAARNLKLDVDSLPTAGKILDEVFGTFVEPGLIQPTFVTDYPLEISPLAKKHRNKPGVVERFEGYAMGKEICNAFSELNDPLDQRERFEEQLKVKSMGDDEAMVIDEDYLRAMEYGMPPIGGLGVGIDRLVMLLTHSASIRDVILFPQMRAEQNE